MRLTPLQQWICDRCGEVIEKPEDGWLEWLAETGTLRKSDFKIVHHAAASPPGEKERDCYHYSNRPRSQDSDLRCFCGADGLAELSAWVYSPGVTDLKQWAETFRRFHVPHYEEAWLYWQTAQSAGYFEGMDEVSRYSQRVLNETIQQHGDEEQP